MTAMAESKPQPKRSNNFTLGIVFGALTGLILSIIFLLSMTFLLDSIPGWLFNILFSIFLTSQLASGGSYIARFIDFVNGEETLFDLCTCKASELKKAWGDFNFLQALKNRFDMIFQKNKDGVTNRNEFIGLVLGLSAAILLAIIQSTLHFTVPALVLLPNVIGGLVQFIFNVANLGGCFSRCGRIIDYVDSYAGPDESAKSFFEHKDVNYMLGVWGGLIAGIIIGVIAIAILGSSVASMGLTVPGWAVCLIFFVTLLGNSASFGGYIGRCFDAGLGDSTIINAIMNKEVKPKNTYEAKLTMIGVGLGLVIAISLMATGITTMPLFGSGAAPLLAGFLLFIFTVSQCGGLFNRIGRVLDKAYPPVASSVVEEKPVERLRFSPNQQNIDLQGAFPKANKSHVQEKKTDFCFWEKFRCCGFWEKNTTTNTKADNSTDFSDANASTLASKTFSNA